MLGRHPRACVGDGAAGFRHAGAVARHWGDEQADPENLFGYAQGVFDAEIRKQTRSATEEVMH